MEGSQQFRLKWNNYHMNIASSFDSLRLDEDFVDVTLACDGFQAKAHRMVLSACSPYFRELLKSNPHPHPIVILRGVSRRNMQLMLDYMYHGEVNVAQAQLADFLKVAEMLKVKGLADDRPSDRAAAAAAADTNGGAPTEWPRADSPAAEAPPEKRRRGSPVAARAVKEEPPERAARPETEPEPEPELPPEPEPEPKREPDPPPEAADQLPERVPDSPPADLSTGQSGGGPGPSSVVGYDTGQESPLAPDPITRLMSCPHCTHLSNNYGKLKAHIGKVHFPVPVSCVDCGKVCKNKYAMQVHKSKYHRRSWKTAGGAPPAAVAADLSPPAAWPALAAQVRPLPAQVRPLTVRDGPSPAAGLDLTRRQGLSPGAEQMQ